MMEDELIEKIAGFIDCCIVGDRKTLMCARGILDLIRSAGYVSREEHLEDIQKILKEIEDNSQFVVIDLHNTQRELRILESLWQSAIKRYGL